LEISVIGDQLWENQPNHRLLQNEMEARKVDAVINCSWRPIFLKSSLLTKQSGKFLWSTST